MLFYLEIVLASFIAGALDTVVGFGGGLLLLPVLVMTVGSKDAVLLAALIPLGWNLSRLVLLRRQVSWRATGLFTLGILPGAMLGAAYLSSIDPGALEVGIGGMLALFGLYYILRLYMAIPFPSGLKDWVFPIVGLVSGAIGSAVGAGNGPIQVGALAAASMPVREIAATGGALGGVTSIARVAAYGAEGLLYPELWIPAAVGIAGAVGGCLLGIRLSRRAKDSTLELLVGVVILLAGIKMLI